MGKGADCGVVKALRYDVKEKEFVAKIEYHKKKSTISVSDRMSVTDDWVIDTYGKDIARKLMDRAEHEEFIEPLNEDGVFARVKLDQRNICRVKYCPEKYVHETDDKGVEYVTNEVHVKAMWKGLLDDGTITLLNEGVVSQFGQRFVNECKTLASRKFVDIPVGSCRSSVMTICPGLRCDNAPPVKFMQGENDSCVFSSLASAFHQTGIPDLLRTANCLQNKSHRLSGGTDCLRAAIEIVDENVKWLQPSRMKKSFQWENDINEYMFFVGVMMDNTGSCQHAVTIFRNWIYDSNEPFALPLSKESLDCCTWTVKDGAVQEASMFVSFLKGWILQENPSSKKKRVLDLCASYAAG